ncbi:MAG: rhomboid family intramembrane serine protease [Bacteroidetes bacterium]|nr:rhomboid family intramembrane serine protease [Bacteroidota bacterium]
MHTEDNSGKLEWQRLKTALFIPVLFVALLWAIKLGELVFGLELGVFGIYPRTAHGLIGIVTSPLIHANLQDHLYLNSLPLIILWTGILYFYRKIAMNVFFWIYLISGIGVWIFARNAYHIGASGLIYGLVAFIFFSGIIRKNASLLALSLFVTFIYGGLIWGVLPSDPTVSWEAHLFGAIAGIICAFYYRKMGPQRQRYQWEFEDDDDDDINLDELEKPQEGKIKIRYLYKREDGKQDNLN